MLSFFEIMPAKNRLWENTFMTSTRKSTRIPFFKKIRFANGGAGIRVGGSQNGHFLWTS